MNSTDRAKLQSIVSRQIESATGTLNSDISNHRAELHERYMGEPYGDEIDNRSKVVMSDIADTIEWIMPEMMDIFTAGDDTVEFSPQGKEDEDAAKQETATVNYIFNRKNEGFLIMYQWFKDALLQKNGIVKSYWDEREVTEIEEYDDLQPEELVQIIENLMESADEVEPVEQEGGLDEMTGELTPIRVKFQIKRKLQEYRIENVPPEELLISPRWNSIFIKGCPFVAHRRTIPASELIEMGFERKQVESLPRYNDEDYSEEKVERFNSLNNSEYEELRETDESMREVLVYEAYVRADMNGDGIAETLQVFVGGTSNEILRWADGKLAVEEVDEPPFDAITPIIVSHKFFGRSVAELVEDLQRIRTVLVRLMLDNTYTSQNARPLIPESAIGENTMSDLLNTRPGYPIRYKGQLPPIWDRPPTLTAEVLQAVEYIDHLRENRTGVTKYNQGLDADSLNKTATGIRSILSASQKKVLLIARVFAETGVKSLFRRMHKDLRKGPLREITMRLNNDWVPVNPRVWKERADMGISVGLGTGDKDEILQRLMVILGLQKEGLQIGLATPENLYHSASKLIETAGFKQPEMFFTDPKNAEPQQQQPDPMMAAIQAEMQVEGQKIEADMTKAQIKAQADMHKAQMQDDRERDKANMEFVARILDMMASGEIAVTQEQIRAANQQAVAMNQPGPMQ